MNKTIISWTNLTWNFIHGCSKVSDGCKHCYAMTISLQKNFTKLPWTLQNEDENVMLKPHKLNEVYKLKEPQRIFVNSMSDMFHRAVPDWYKAVGFCVMLDNPQHVFQVLTKRADATIDWHIRFLEALKSAEFKQFAREVKDKRIQAALAQDWHSPWADHIWMGTSVEDGRVLKRIDQLRQSQAHIKFISAEPLLGAWGQVDLSGIHWVIVGGESGHHIKDNPDRFMKQEWAREIKNLCVDQSVAFFYKQDSGYKTELRPYLIEADNSKWKWEQYPHDLKPPVLLLDNEQPVYSVDTSNKSADDCTKMGYHYEKLAYNRITTNPDLMFLSDNYAMLAGYWYKSASSKRIAKVNTPAIPVPAQVINEAPQQMTLF